MGSGLQAGFRRLVTDHREYVATGVVVSSDRPAGEAPGVTLELADGRQVIARAAYPGRSYTPHDVGDEVLVVFDGGDANAAIVVGRLVNGQQLPPSEVDDSGRYLFEQVVEVRASTGQAVDGVVLRALLDDLATVVTDLQALVDAIAAGVPGTTPGNSSMLSAMKGTAAALTTSLTTLATGLGTSKAGQGAAPYCSPVLRATDGT